MTDTTALLLLPRLRVQNANAISGPLTWGFPSPTAFTGFVHALQRRLSASIDVEFAGVGIICHRFDPQVHQPAGRRNQVFSLTRNPIGRDGGTAALVEEGRAHLEVSLLIELVTDLDEDDQETLLDRLMPTVHSMRLAGGSILPDYDQRHRPTLVEWWDDDEDNVTEFRKLSRRLLPGFALVQREDLLAAHLDELRRDNDQHNALDALLDLTRLNVEPGEAGSDPDKLNWSIRSHPGWLVPIPVGYAALSPLYPPGEVIDARDQQTPFCFVESLYSLGQWLSPHRLSDAQQLFWRHSNDIDAGIYRCINHYTPPETTA